MILQMVPVSKLCVECSECRLTANSAVRVGNQYQYRCSQHATGEAHHSVKVMIAHLEDIVVFTDPIDEPGVEAVDALITRAEVAYQKVEEFLAKLTETETITLYFNTPIELGKAGTALSELTEGLKALRKGLK